MVNAILAKRVNHIVTKGDNPAWPKGSKSRGFSTIEEVAELTGYKKTTIYKLTHERKIPFHKPAHGGRRIFFKREEINQWLQSNRVETHEEFLKSWRGKNECKIKN